MSTVFSADAVLVPGDFVLLRHGPAEYDDGVVVGFDGANFRVIVASDPRHVVKLPANMVAGKLSNKTFNESSPERYARLVEIALMNVPGWKPTSQRIRRPDPPPKKGSLMDL